MITDQTPDLSVVGSNQVFPFYTYHNNYARRTENITDYALDMYRLSYNDNSITKWDIFYYNYAMLHCVQYKEKYKLNLLRDLPRIPMAPDFWGFSACGRELVELHLHYFDCITVPDNTPIVYRPPGYTIQGTIPDYPKKIRHAKKPNPIDMGPKNIDDINTVLFPEGEEKCIIHTPNTIQYTISGRTPIQWFVTNYRLKKDKDSGITKYPCEKLTGIQVEKIILNMVHIGVQSDAIIRKIPKLFEGHCTIEPKHYTQQTLY